MSLHWQDFDFVLKGLARLLTNPLTQTYLPNSTKKIQFHQELLVLFWKLCDFNKVGTKNHDEVLFALRFCALLLQQNPLLCVFPLQKFLFFVLKSSDVLDILVPILYYLNDARADQCESRLGVILAASKLQALRFINLWGVFPSAARVGLMHIGVFILLLLSGERNFGVRLNKPYSVHVPMDIPVFTGTHADLLIVVRCHFINSSSLRFCTILRP